MYTSGMRNSENGIDKTFKNIVKIIKGSKIWKY